jgi:hypothetical protein
LLALTLAVACGSTAPPARTTTDIADRTPAPEEPPPPPPESRAVARYECDAGLATVRYAIDELPRSCAQGFEGAALVIVQREATEEGAPGTFEFRSGEAAGEGVTCVAPRPCEEAPHQLTVTPGEPPRIEWALSVGEEHLEHGSAAVLICNAPPPCG